MTEEKTQEGRRQVTAPEVRAARKFLKRRNFTVDEISPRLFAKTAKDLDRSFAATLKLLGGPEDKGGD